MKVASYKGWDISCEHSDSPNRQYNYSATHSSDTSIHCGDFQEIKNRIDEREFALEWN